MADDAAITAMKQGLTGWHRWRSGIPPGSAINARGADLRNAFLVGCDLRDVDFQGANFRGANLSEAQMEATRCAGADFEEAKFFGTRLVRADLTDANLRGAALTRSDMNSCKLDRARLQGANLQHSLLPSASLIEADLSGVHAGWSDMSYANLTAANLSNTRLDGVNLFGANLSGARLNQTILEGANLWQAKFLGASLEGCFVHNVAAWEVDLTGALQRNLVITPRLWGPALPREPTVTVDNLELAQFIYLLMSNPKIREVLDTITSKVVLILGRFTPDRLSILDALREALRQRNYVPVLFDFDGPNNRDVTETVVALAHMARFVIADITDPRSIPQELQAIVPGLPSVPVLPLIHEAQREYGMFEHFKRYPWVLELFKYKNEADAIAYVTGEGLAAAERAATECR